MECLPDYDGPARIVDGRGERHPVQARLDWSDEADGWNGTVTGDVEWETLVGELMIELPSNRWWDLPFVSCVEVDRVDGEQMVVHGRAFDVNVDQYSGHNRQPRPIDLPLKI